MKDIERNGIADTEDGSDDDDEADVRDASSHVTVQSNVSLVGWVFKD
jgi:hypothetical protein